MIPLTATLKIKTRNHRGINLWLPLFLIWLLLLPVILLLFPFFLIFCLITLINPIKALKIFWDILAALRGTIIEVEEPHTFIVIRIH